MNRPLPWLPWVSIVLCLAIVIVSSWILVSLGTPSAEQLRLFGAKSNSHISDGESWRIFTCEFVHSSWRHLWWNVAVLFPTMVWLERSIRRIELVYLLIYIVVLSGVMSSGMTSGILAIKKVLSEAVPSGISNSTATGSSSS